VLLPRNWKTALLCLGAAAALGLIPGAGPVSVAQSDTGGTVAGRVLGPDGQGIAGALLRLEDTSGIRNDVASDRAGRFQFAAVLPGEYTLRVHAPGFSDWEASHLNVTLAATKSLTPRLAPAWLHRTVLVDARVAESRLAAQDDASSALAADVPSNSGQWSSDAVVLSGTGASEATGLRGLSPLMTSITVDGMSGKLAFHGRQRATEGNGFATIQSSLSAFHSGSGDFAGVGARAPAGAMSTVTQSGGDHMHGHAVLYDRGSLGQAANAFSRTMVEEPAGTLTANGQPVLYLNGQPVTYVEAPFHAPDRRQRWEVAAGGPIRRDRLWWYFAWGQYLRNDPAVARANEPELFFAAPSAQSLATLQARIATSTHPLVFGCPGPAPGSTARAACAWSRALAQLDGMLGPVPRQTRQTIVFPKLSWRFNPRHQLTAQYNSMRRTGLHSALGGATETDAIGSFGNSNTSDDTALARWDWFLTPRLMSSSRFQYNRDLLEQTPGSPSAFEAQFANNVWSLPPQVSIDTTQGLSFGTLSTVNKRKYPLETREQFAEAGTWIHGRQTLRFGYDDNYVTDELEGLNGENGSYSYATLTDFLSDMLAPGSCDGTTTGAGPYPCYSRFRQTIGPPQWKFETADYAGFLANEWKLGQRLVLSLGARYEYEQVPDTNPALVNSDIPRTSRLVHDRTGFGPRGGFAWDLFGRGRTLLRGGYGIYTARIPNAMVFSALTSTGSARSPRTYSYRPLDVAAPAFPYVFSSDAQPFVNPSAPNHNSSAPEAVYFDPRFRHPQIQSMELSLQQDLGFRTLLTVTGMATDARFLTQFIDTNIDLLNWAYLFYTVQAPGNQSRIGPLGNAVSGVSGYTNRVYEPRPFYYQRLNPAYGSITDMVSETNSSYRGAVVQLTRRISRGLTVNAAYTWAHAIDDNQNEATFAERNNVYDPADLSLEHGTSNYDVRQRVAGGFLLREPWRLRGPAEMLAGGYSIAGTGAWRTGLPWSMRTAGSVPTPSCSYASWLNAGGATADGANCLRAVSQPDETFTGGIAGMAVPIASLGGTLNGAGGENLLPPIGRNTFRYPATVNLDLRFTKRIRISDRSSFEVMGEAFNALNHRNVTNFQTVGYRVTNDRTHPNMATLTWQSGIKPGTKTVFTNGTTQTQYVEDLTAAFGAVTNANSGAVNRERQLQLGIRLNY
jgi:hypothetical protein